MPEFEMPLPAGIRITNGNWYHDKWITSELDFEFLTSSETKSLALAFWNPNFSTRLMNNSMLVSLAGQMQQVIGIKLGQVLTVDIQLDAPLQAGDVLSLRVQNKLQPSKLDMRERAIILTRMGWV